MRRNLVGSKGEKIACDFLRADGYKILSQNFRVKSGEIDIIVSKGGVIIFVEVKTRSSFLFGTPAQAVGQIKQNKIINTAWSYLKQAGKMSEPFRFDVVEVVLNPAAGTGECNHIINAFGR